jgi:tRNA threonylcarbamoyl adenosine modification protein (Sua5/YciO/YrdC/YwlC family)
VRDPGLEAALERVRAGGLVAYPTETLYGLGADATSARAVARLRAWKRRGDEPLALLVDGMEPLLELGFELPGAARTLIEALWPGPLTLVLRTRARFAPGVARDDGAVGVRCSPHPVAAAFAAALSGEKLGPVTATSLNRSGEPPARTRVEARALLGGDPGAPLLLDVAGTPEPGGTQSSVLDLTGSRPRLLREGALPTATLAALLGEAPLR